MKEDHWDKTIRKSLYYLDENISGVGDVGDREGEGKTSGRVSGLKIMSRRKYFMRKLFIGRIPFRGNAELEIIFFYYQSVMCILIRSLDE